MIELTGVPSRVHRPRWRQVIMTVLITGVLLTFCPIVLVLATGGEGVSLIIAFVGTFAVMAVYFLYLSSRIRVITSPNGIEYHQQGYYLHATWENVESIGKVNFGRLEREGLFVRNALMKTTSIYRILHGSAVYDVRSRFIPFTPLMPDWRDSELGLDILQYAPHVFDTQTTSGEGMAS